MHCNLIGITEMKKSHEYEPIDLSYYNNDASREEKLEKENFELTRIIKKGRNYLE